MIIEAFAAFALAWFFWFVAWDDGWGWGIPALWFTAAGAYLLFQ
jgi:hypothetical protein